MINALIWLPFTKPQDLRSGMADGTLRKEVVQALRDNADFGRAVNDGQTLTLMVRDEPEIDTVLAEDDNAQLVGAWDYYTGEKVRPLNKTLYLDSQPDEVTFDEDGNITNRQRPTERKLTNIWSGQAPRDLS